MASNGIRDRVAIVGMGCTPFGEHWDKSASDLLVDATGEALTSAGDRAAPTSTRSGSARCSRARAGSRCRGRSRSTTSR